MYPVLPPLQERQIHCNCKMEYCNVMITQTDTYTDVHKTEHAQAAKIKKAENQF